MPGRALVLIFSLLFLYTSAQSPALFNSIITLPPCTTNIYQWTVSTPLQEFDLSLTLHPESNAAFTIVLFRNASGLTSDPRGLGCHSVCVTTTSAPCSPSLGNLACNDKKGTWYYSVSHSSPTPQNFSVSNTISPLAVPSVLPLSSSDSDKGTTFAGGAFFGNSSDIEYYLVDLDPVEAVDGSRFVVRVKADNPVTVRMSYGTSVASATCSNFEKVQTGTDVKLILSPCEYEQGGKYLVAVHRLSNTITYNVLSYVDVPEIIPILVDGRHYGTINQEDKLIYYSFVPTQAMIDGTTHFVAVISDVTGGEVRMSIRPFGSPVGRCPNSGGKTATCSTFTGCHVRVFGCDVQGKSGDLWYVSVHSNYLDDIRIPIQYTIDIFSEEHSNHAQLAIGSSHPDKVRHGKYRRFFVPATEYSSTEWVRIYVYFDASDPVSYPQKQGTLYVSSSPNAGDYQHCQTHQLKCDATITNRDYKACSVQLDPCNLAENYPDGIYFSVYGTETINYYFEQQDISFTLLLSKFNPDTQYIDENTIINGVVASGEYAIYRIAPFSLKSYNVLISAPGNEYNPLINIGALQAQDFCDSYTHQTNEACVSTGACCVCDTKCVPTNFACPHNMLCTNPQKRDVSQQNQNTVLEVKVFYGPELVGDYCKGGCRIPDRTPVFINTGNNPSDLGTFDSCDPEGNGFYVAIKGNDRNVIAANNYKYTEIPFVLTVTSASQETDIQIIVAEPGIEYSPRDFNKVYFELSFDRSNALQKDLFFTTRAQPNPLSTQQLFAISDSVSTTCGISNGDEIFLNIGCNNNRDGYCQGYFRGCTSFTQSNINGKFLFYAQSNGNFQNDGAMSFRYDVVEQFTTELSNGLSRVDTLKSYVYNHYSFYVPPDAVNKKNLILEIYFENGHLMSGSKPMLYILYPNAGGSRAGNPNDCLCLDDFHELQPSENGKLAWAVEACSIKEGTYHFSIITQKPLIDASLIHYTITATLQDPVEGPYDLSATNIIESNLFGRLKKILVFNIQPFVSTSVDQVLHIDLTTAETLPNQAFRARLYYTPEGSPTTCACASDTNYLGQLTYNTNPHNKISGSIVIPSCYFSHSTNTKLNLEIENVASSSTINSHIHAFSVHASIKNAHPVVTQLKVDTPCSTFPFPDNKKIVSVVKDGNYQFFYVDSNAAYSVVVDSAQDGNVILVGGPSQQVAVRTCATEVSGSLPLVRPINCPNGRGNFSVYGNANSEKPVTFTIYACSADASTPVQENTLAIGVAKQEASLPRFSAISYKIDISTIRNADALQVLISNSVDLDTSPISLSLRRVYASSGGCNAQTCPAGNPINFEPSSVCYGNCYAVILKCRFPQDFDQGTWYLDIQNTGALDVSYSVVYNVISKTDLTLPAGNHIDTNFTIPVGQLRYLTYTVTPNQIMLWSAGQQALKYSFAKYNTVTFQNNFLLYQVNTDGSCPTINAINFDQCCASSVTNIYGIFNADPVNAVVVNWKADLDTISVHKAKAAGETETLNVPAQFVPYPAMYNVYVDYTPLSWVDATGESAIWITVERGSMVDGRLFITNNDNPAGAIPCLNNNGQTNQNFLASQDPADYSALTLHDDSCRNLFFSKSGRYWIGVLNRDAAAVTVPVTVHVEPSTALTLGTAASFNLRLNHYKLYYLVLDDALANDPNVNLNINLNQDASNTIPATIRVSLQLNYPSCGGAPATINANLVGTNFVINTNISSCNWVNNSGRKLYISVGSGTALPGGIQRRIAGSFTVTKVTTPISNDHGSITVGTALSSVSLVSGETKRFRFRSSASPSITSTSATYYRAQAYNFDIANPLISITYETDTKRMCTSSIEDDNTFCNIKRDTCYGVLHSCRLFPNTDYVVVITNSGPDTTFSLLLNTFTKEITELSLSSPKNDGSLQFGDIQFYRFSLKGVLSYYETFDMTLSDLSCGSLRYYVESDNVAGPDCFDTTGTNIGSIFSKTGCQLTADLDTEYYVTVIGTDQYSVSPLTYKLSLTVKNTATLVNLQPGEMDYLRYIPDSIVTPPVCPVPSSPFVPCCSSTFVPQTTMRQENKLWVYTVEGYNYIEEHDTLVIEHLAGGIQSVTVTLEHRRLYSTDDCTPIDPSPNPNPIDCLGSPCEIALYDYDFLECHGKDVQIFISVTVTFSNTLTGSNPLNVISLYHKRTPYALSDVAIPSSPATKTELFYQFSLPLRYRQLFRFSHPSTYQNNNYKFRASVDAHTPNSQLQLRNSFSRCPSINSFCNQNQPCLTTSYPPPCGTFQPDYCTCNAGDDEELRVDSCTNPSSLGVNNRTFLTFYANNNGGIPVQSTTLRLDYYVNSIPLVENTCIKIEANEVIYYSYTFANPKPSERFNFGFDVISGSAEFSVEDGCETICSNAGSGGSWNCYNERGSSNSFVIKILAYDLTYFKLSVSKQNNTFTNLQNGVLHSNPSTVFNPCETKIGNNLYSYTSSAATPGSNKYLLFEFFHSTNNVEMTITPDHTYTLFNGDELWACSTSAGYCRIIIGCGYSATTYFIHLPVNYDATFRIRATEGTSRVVDGVFGLNLFTPGVASGILPGEIISYKFPLKSTATPDDIITTNIPALNGLTSWITRNYFGDPSCAVGTGIRPCAVSSSAEEFFFVNFFYSGIQAVPCQIRPYAFSVTQFNRYLTNRITAQNAQANVNVTNSLTSLQDRHRYKLTFPALTNDDVVVISFVGSDKTILLDGEFGNYKNGATVGYNEPCSCSRKTNEVFRFPVRNQIILDKCDHCGNSYYDSYFVDVRLQNALTYPYQPLSYYFQYTVKKYKPLTATFARHTLRSDTIDHEFFKVTASDSQAQRLEVEILGSRGVLVELLSEECGRTVIKSLNCLKGSLCQLPIPDHRNIGDLSSSSTLYFRVTGFDTQFEIRYLKGIEALVLVNPTEAPFCSPFIAGLVWGPAQALTRRDNHANKLYSELNSDFACGGSACTCTELSEACLNSLKLFACSISLRPGDGRVNFVQKADCLAVETNCGRSFLSTDNFGHFTCSSAAYQNSELTIDPRINPNPPTVLVLNGAGMVVSNVLFMLLLMVVLLLVN